MADVHIAGRKGFHCEVTSSKPLGREKRMERKYSKCKRPQGAGSPLGTMLTNRSYTGF